MLALAPALEPGAAQRLGPAAAQALLSFRSPQMAESLDSALFPDLKAGTKPFGYATLDALARRIHRDRKGEVLQLAPARVQFRDQARTVTRILAEQPASGRTRLIGFAWTAGRPREALEAALERVEPSARYEGRGS